jgi:hypothetical protein
VLFHSVDVIVQLELLDYYYCYYYYLTLLYLDVMIEFDQLFVLARILDSIIFILKKKKKNYLKIMNIWYKIIIIIIIYKSPILIV